MKKSLIALVALLALALFVAVPAKTTQAASPGCWSDPEEGPIGTDFGINCSGFPANTWLWVYAVQPDGAAEAWGSIKTDEGGNVAFGTASKGGNSYALALGAWTVVVEQRGLANAILNEAKASFRITGGTEGVAGAYLWTDVDQVEKEDTFWVYGSGFGANEIVTVWYEFPNGDCSSTTWHLQPVLNYPIVLGLSTEILGDVKTDASGSFAFWMGFNPVTCEGKYRLVARGNSSGWGDETWVTITGHAVTESAWLDASKDVVAAMMDTQSFTGSGFGANEPISCWLRSPQNQALSVTDLQSIKSDSSGAFSFSIWTGSYYPGLAYWSEGALGVYAMTCRGDVSGATGIAEFTVTGGTFDP